MSKYQYWEFAQGFIASKAINDERQASTAGNTFIDNYPNLKRFDFKVDVLHDAKSNRQYIRIEAHLNNEPATTLTTNLVDIDKDVEQLKSFGILLNRTQHIELCRIIRDNYYDLKITKEEINKISEEKVADIVEFLCRHIYQKEIAPTAIKSRTGSAVIVYHIPVIEFNTIMKDSQYKDLQTTSIKEALHENGYTYTNKGSFDCVAHIDDKRTKMLSLIEDKVKDILEQFSQE